VSKVVITVEETEDEILVSSESDPSVESFAPGTKDDELPLSHQLGALGILHIQKILNDSRLERTDAPA
jgi:hypothetical protein